MKPQSSHWTLGIASCIVWLTALALALTTKGSGLVQWLVISMFVVGTAGLTYSLCASRSTGLPPEEPAKKQSKAKRKPNKTKKK